MSIGKEGVVNHSLRSDKQLVSLEILELVLLGIIRAVSSTDHLMEYTDWDFKSFTVEQSEIIAVKYGNVKEPLTYHLMKYTGTSKS